MNYSESHKLQCLTSLHSVHVICQLLLSPKRLAKTDSEHCQNTVGCLDFFNNRKVNNALLCQETFH